MPPTEQAAQADPAHTLSTPFQDPFKDTRTNTTAGEAAPTNTPDDFGLDPAAVDRRFARYREWVAAATSS